MALLTLVPAPTTTCTACDHDADVHQHLRRGTDCALCDCARLESPGSGLLASLTSKVRIPSPRRG